MAIPTRDRLIIHAGMHKTGSTSIQAALARRNCANAHPLRLHNDNHSEACILLFSEAPEKHFSFRRRGLTVKMLAERRADLERKLARQLRNRHEQTFVLSAEWVSTAPPQALVRVHDRFAPHFRRIDVYAYVRPPGEFLASSLQQGIKTGSREFKLWWPDYQQRFEKLDNMFGRENVHLRVFSAPTLKNADVVEDFSDWTGLSLAQHHQIRKNTSMSALALALAFCYRRNSRQAVDAPARHLRDRQVLKAFMALAAPPFQLSMGLVDKAISANAADLEWVENRLGCSLAPPRQDPDPDTVVFDGPGSLIKAAARFSPVLEGLAPGGALSGVAASEALAWRRIESFIERLPVTGHTGPRM